jgi:hypothetical protein
MQEPVTAETVGILTDKKCKLDSELSGGEKITSTSKRTKTNDSSGKKSSTQNKEASGSGAAESSGPREISMKHPVNVQNTIYTAERLSCSLDLTHSLNFILIGEFWVNGELLHSLTHLSWQKLFKPLSYPFFSSFSLTIAIHLGHLSLIYCRTLISKAPW